MQNMKIMYLNKDVTHTHEASLELDILVQAVINTHKFAGDHENPPEDPYIDHIIIKLGDIDITEEICDHTKARLEDDTLQSYYATLEN